ncbi:hypothetical protein LOTGIDRAFT_169853 [Lottia gigantea]|uniref:C3H1-type domain-containing protein n=1 Tax=Lottia gigantea TaxID=225164 RepID=V3ZEL8_LOTGI|nr:hypothetical protein LOTGIDRAFT_169853 [Lottia gigantea]ESO82532.1 hypothetical protein LOTGIDRAFT_169853 [Lottia gigantea]
MAERSHTTRSEDLARSAIQMIASRNGENMDFNRLQSKLNIESRSELLDCLLDYPQIFAFCREHGRSEMVNLVVQVNLCPDYCSESNCDDRDCPMFHICKFYILSDGCLSKRNTCKYGHALNSEHNIKLFRALLLDDLPYKYLQKLFRLRRNRTEASIPRICSFYNVSRGCSKGGKCTSLHICEHYVWGNCKFGRGKCNRSHEILNNEKILKRFGINTERNQSAILGEIKDMYDMIEERKARNANYSRPNEVDYNKTRGPRNNMDSYTPRAQMVDTFNNMTISQQATSNGSVGHSYNRQHREQLNRSWYTPIQQSRSRQMQLIQSPVAYPIQHPQPGQRPGLRYNSAPSCHTRSQSHHQGNRKLFSKARRFGSSTNIATQSNEPTICQYYLAGNCRYKNHCKNIHPRNDDHSSDSESEGDSDRTYTSDESDDN